MNGREKFFNKSEITHGQRNYRHCDARLALAFPLGNSIHRRCGLYPKLLGISPFGTRCAKVTSA